MTEPAIAVVDASVAVEYLLGLSLASQATTLFRQLSNPDPIDLWAPDLLHLEVASVARKLARQKLISSRDGERALVHLTRLPIHVAGTASMLLDIWKARDKLTPYDAAYVSLARELNAPLITADAKLARAFPLGVRVQRLQDR